MSVLDLRSPTEEELLSWWGPEAAERTHLRNQAIVQRMADQALDEELAEELAVNRAAEISPTLPCSPPQGIVYVFAFGDTY